MTNLQLAAITLGSVKNGGYVIRYTGAAPPKAKLMLRVGAAGQPLDVTGRKAGDLLGSDNLPAFLACVGKSGLWGKRASCSLESVADGKVIAKSNVVEFDAPVRPYAGRLHPAMIGKADGGPTLRYTGNGTGRMLRLPAIDGCYYYTWAGKFETSDANRGFDCTTFAGAAFGVDPATGALAKYGTQLATHLGATQIGLENKTGDEIRAHFAKSPTGTYLMWSEGHVVVVLNATVHEFSPRAPGGYFATPIRDWNFHGKRFWVRKPTKQF